MSSNPRVYLLKDGYPVGQSASRSVGFSKWTVLIGRTGFGTIPSIPDPTLSLMRLYCVVVKDTGKIINARMRRAKLLDSLQALKAGWCQGLTLIHVRAQLELLQDTCMS